MNDNESLESLLNDYRNSVKSNLTNEELIEVDKYIEKTISDLKPVLSIIESLSNDKESLGKLKNDLDEYMRDEKWLEKLLKTSWFL